MHDITVFFQQAGDSMDVDGKDDETPTEEMIERMEERLESAQSEQKNLFLIVFQVCTIQVVKHLRCQTFLPALGQMSV